MADVQRGWCSGLLTAVMPQMEMALMENHDPNDPVAVYVLEVSKVEPLTKMEETKLFRELGHSGDWDEEKENVARRLIESQLMLVVSIARKHSASGVHMLDLIQEGNIGLMKAVRSFTERPIGDFTAHAAACIEDAITKVLGKSS
jgi:RNA polymerase primary sigma factor